MSTPPPPDPHAHFEISLPLTGSRPRRPKGPLRTLGDLTRVSGQLLSSKSFGETSLQEIRRMMTARGLRLGQAHELPPDWPSCNDPNMMLELFLDHASARQRRLFACACCRRFPGVLDEPTARWGIEVAERFADAEASRDELQEARAATFVLTRTHRTAAFRAVSFVAVEDQLGSIACNRVSECAAGLGFGAVQCAWFRDFFAPPGKADSLARTVYSGGLAGATALTIARTIYDERRFDDLPVLADALEDAGCDDETILGHCRDAADHARGCWVVDRILGLA